MKSGRFAEKPQIILIAFLTGGRELQLPPN